MKITSPKQLYEWIDKNIQYGWYDFIHNKKIFEYMLEWKEPNYFEKYCRIVKPEEMIELKIGTCWDIALFEYQVLKNNGYEPTFHFICTHDDVSITHTLVIYKYQKYYYWFEWAWLKYVGLHKLTSDHITSKKQLYKTIKDIYKKENILLDFYEVDANRLLGIQNLFASDFLRICSNGNIITNITPIKER